MTDTRKKVVLIIVISLIVIIMASIIFFGDKVLYDLAKIYDSKYSDNSKLGKDTFLFAVIGKDENDIENISSLFLVDIYNNNIQVISIPLDLKVAIPEISQEKIGELHPFGSGSLLAGALSGQLGLTIDYYIMINNEHLEDFLHTAAPISVTLKKDIHIGRNIFKKGIVDLDSAGLRTFLSMNMYEDGSHKLQANKLFIVKEVINNMRKKEINLSGMGAPGTLETNIENSPLINNRFYNYGKMLFDLKKMLFRINGVQYAESMGEKNKHLDLIDSIIMNADTSIYYTCLSGTYEESNGDLYFILTGEAKNDTVNIIKNNSYISLDFQKESDFYETGSAMPDNELIEDDDNDTAIDGQEESPLEDAGNEDTEEEITDGDVGEEDAETIEEIILTAEEEKAKEKIQLKIINSGDNTYFQSVLNKVEMLGYLEENLIIDEAEQDLLYGDSLIYYKMEMDKYAAELGSILGIEGAFINPSEDEPGFADILIIIGIDHNGE